MSTTITRTARPATIDDVRTGATFVPLTDSSSFEKITLARYDDAEGVWRGHGVTRDGDVTPMCIFTDNLLNRYAVPTRKPTEADITVGTVFHGASAKDTLYKCLQIVSFRGWYGGVQTWNCKGHAHHGKFVGQVSRTRGTLLRGGYVVDDTDIAPAFTPPTNVSEAQKAVERAAYTLREAERILEAAIEAAKPKWRNVDGYEVTNVLGADSTWIVGCTMTVRVRFTPNGKVYTYLLHKQGKDKWITSAAAQAGRQVTFAAATNFLDTAVEVERHTSASDINVQRFTKS